MSSKKRRQTLLIIDDTAENIILAVELFRAYQFEILTARDGETGLKRALLTVPDLILLDVQMPGIDGYETCRRLKAAPETSGIPVIFMTVLADTRDKLQGFQAGAVDFVTKPLNAAELLARVQTHLRLHQLQLEVEEHAAGLESRVAERTAELEREVLERSRAQHDREQLLELVRLQGEQLRALTLRWLEEQRERDRGISSSLQARIQERLSLLHLHLQQARQLLSTLSLAGDTMSALDKHLEVGIQLLGPTLDETQLLRTHLEEQSINSLSSSPLLRLSTREYEVLQLMVQGKSNKEIAYLLDVARTTISTYRMRIMEKLEVQDMAALLRLAIQHDSFLAEHPVSQDA